MTDDNNKNAKLAIRALNSLYEAVMDIYENKDKTDPKNDYNLIINSVHEQALAHRIAHYLENKLEYTIKTNGLSIDCEYNKRIDNQQESHTKITFCDNCCNDHCIVKNNSDNINIIKTSRGNTRQYRPDIILHVRNTDINILACEMKISELTYKKKIKTDFLKLKAYTCEDNFNYFIGVSIILKKDYPVFTCFTNKDMKRSNCIFGYENFNVNPELD